MSRCSLSRTVGRIPPNLPEMPKTAAWHYDGEVRFASLRKFPIRAAAWAFLPVSLFGLGQPSYVSTSSMPGGFPIVQSKSVAAVYVDPDDFPGVARAASDLRGGVWEGKQLVPRAWATSGCCSWAQARSSTP